MKIETIKVQAEDIGLQGARLKRFIHFFSNRFPDESETIHSYVREWATRFKGDPVPKMDLQSREIYFSFFDDENKKQLEEQQNA